MRSRITAMLSAFALFLNLASQAYAIQPEFSGCSYSQNHPCPEKLMTHKDGEAHVEGFCRQMEINDRACHYTMGLAAAYTAVAAACSALCVSSIFTLGLSDTFLSSACIAGSIAAGVADIAAGIKLNNDMAEMQNKYKDVVLKDFGLAPRIAGPVVAGAGLFTAFVFGGVNATSTYVTGATNAIKVGSAAGGAAQTMGSSSATTVTTEVSSNTEALVGSCVTAAATTAVASLKWAEETVIKNHSEKTFHQMCDPMNSQIDCRKPSHSDLATTPSNITGNGLSTGGTAPPSLAKQEGLSLSDQKKIDDDFNSGKIAQNMATSDFGKIFNKSPHDIQKALDAFKNGTGLSLGQFANQVKKGGLGSALAQFTKDAPASSQAAVKDALKKLEAEMRAQHLGSILAFGESSSRSSAGKTAGSSPFAGLFQGSNRELSSLAGGAQDLKFSGFKGDIWHAGSTKTIFEIVSEKTSSVSNRVGH
ncbi:MAG: hypothetical protein AB1540_13670 [Bdellovibrionota bacterium]